MAVDEGSSGCGTRRGVRKPPGLGVASLGVRGDLLERWKAALREGVKGLGVCLSEVMVATLWHCEKPDDLQA